MRSTTQLRAPATKRTPPLPDPLVIGRLRYWRRGHIRAYLAQVEGKPAPEPQADDEHLMLAKELRLMLGGVSDMWIHRHSRRTDAQGVA